MIQMQSKLRVLDNSGASSATCIAVVGGGYGTVGDVIVVAVHRKKGNPKGKVTQGEVKKAVIVRIKSPIRRSDGTTISFGDNAVVLINNNNEPIGTRINGCVARELRTKGFMKIISLAPEVL